MKIKLFCLIILSYKICFAQSLAVISGVFLNSANDTISLSYNDHASVGIAMEVKLPIVNNRFYYSMIIKHSTYI